MQPNTPKDYTTNKLYNNTNKNNKRFSNNLKAIIKRIATDFKKYNAFLIACALFFVAAWLIFRKVCPLVITTGYPCPGCGITRALYYLVTFRFGKAFQMNPCVYIWSALAVYIFINRYILGKKAKHLPVLCMIVGISSIIIYVARMYYMFPNVAPMTYYENNIISLLRSFFG